MNIWLFGAAVALVVVLAAYAGYLHWQLHGQRQRQRNNDRARLSGARVGVVEPEPGTVPQQRVALNRSLYLLADAILDDKLSHTEGCLRICAIAAAVEDQQRFRLEYGVLFRVAEATAHIPILDAWKALPADDKIRLDKERKAIELKYNDAVVEAAKRLKEHYPL